MAKLLRSFSIKSIGMEAAIRQGRPHDVMHELVGLLREGKADGAVQKIAADWIESVGLKPGDAKALRGGKKEALSEWVEIAEMVMSLQRDGKTYKDACLEAEAYFPYGERHIQKCVALMNKVLEQEAAQK